MQLFTGKQYLEIDIANSYGLDKETWNKRLEWFEANRSQLERAPFGDLVQFAQNAEEPPQFLAGVNAYRKMLLGQPTGYLCGLDATASGIQLLSAMSGCHDSAQQCNLVHTGKREDTYTNVHVAINDVLGSQSVYQRKPVKQATMTHFYGSKAVPRETFGEDTPELEAFYKTIDKLLPGANMLNRDLLILWRPDALAHEWTLPDGFDVKVKVMANVEHGFTFLGDAHTVIEKVNAPQESGLSIGANIVHSIDGMVVREMGRRCNFDADKLEAMYQMLHIGAGGTSTLREKDLALLRVLALADQAGFLSVVMFEYLDEQNLGHLSPAHRAEAISLMESMPAKPFKLLAIHDCFKFHANYGNDVREQYRNILAELADSNILSSIATQIRGTYTPVNKITPNLSTHIRQSEYALS